MHRGICTDLSFPAGNNPSPTPPILAGELEYRTAAFARLQELKVKMDRAVKRASLAERELATTR